MARRSSPSVDPAVLEEVRSIYDALTQRPSQRRCEARTTCCRFQLTGELPLVTRAEALYAAVGVRASGRKAVKPHPDGACPLLGKDGRCTIYAHRPFGCRTHFCTAAGGMYPRREVADLIQRLDALDEKIQGQGSRDLPDAIAVVLDGK
ncbi:MAG: YkgJ family cysteine cluster protein [Verrucomicrobiaceae bacterium]|nr:YkgJ family cysteine cluster protein [Verrucomicrobiaceae bacterium]